MKRMLLCLLLAAGCAGAPVDEAGDTELAIEHDRSSEAPLWCFKPDLLRPDTIRVTFAPWLPPQIVPMGGLINAPCGTQAIQVDYQYKNIGSAFAPAHSNRMFVATQPSQIHGGPPIGPGGMGSVSAPPYSFSIPRNVVHGLTLGIEAPNAISECSEANNVFNASIVVSCP